MYLSSALNLQRQTRLADIAKRLRNVDAFVRYHPFYHHRALRAARAFDAAGRVERRGLLCLLEQRIEHYAFGTEYGRRLAAGEHWPILDKAALRDDPAAFRTPGRFAIPASTGGTTGAPIRLWRSLECVAAERAFIDHMLSEMRLSFRTSRIAVLRGDDVKDPADEAPPYGVQRHGGRRLILSTPHLSCRTIRWFVDALRRFRPEILWVYPGPLANLIKLAREADLDLRVPIVLSSSETMPRATAEAACNMLSSKVIDYYGLAERACFAYSFRPGEYWFQPAYGSVELVAADDCQVVDDIVQLKIVATGFWNVAMPLMRYDTGDHALVRADATAADLEGIALGLTPFLGIAGRANDYVAAPDGARISALDHIARGVDNVLRLQLVQHHPMDITVRVLAQPGFGPADQSKILSNARLKFPPAIAVSVAVVDELETLPNGKTPYLVKHASL